MPYYILLGFGRVRFVGITVLAAGVVGIGGMYFAISDIGLIGAPVGRGVYALLTLVLIVPLVRYFRQNSNDDLRKDRSIGSSREGESLL